MEGFRSGGIEAGLGAKAEFSERVEHVSIAGYIFFFPNPTGPPTFLAMENYGALARKIVRPTAFYASTIGNLIIVMTEKALH